MIEYAIGFYLGGLWFVIQVVIWANIAGKDIPYWNYPPMLIWPVILPLIVIYAAYKVWLGYEYKDGGYVMRVEDADA